MQYQIARALAEANSINEAGGKVLRLICETVGWEYGALWLVEPDATLLKNEGVWYADGSNFSDFGEAARYSVLHGDETSLPGYVFQAGEALNGRPLIDRQHPHDFFMQLAAIWRLPVGRSTGLIGGIEEIQ